MSSTAPLVATLVAPLQAALAAIIASPTATTLEAQGVQIAGEEVAALLQAEPQLIGIAAQHLLTALDGAVAAAPTQASAPGSAA